ncbi:hypothetical protein LUZ60_015001 [Juncus effusus]|nr:hypothetical protein LUZ60_015001 [Juncus effusus]
MALPLAFPSTTSWPSTRFPLLSPRPLRRPTLVSAVATEKKSRRKKKQKAPSDSDDEQPSSSSSSSSIPTMSFTSAVEKGLRYTFMEELMERARNGDRDGVTDAIYDMVAAGLTPGPRSFHGLVVSHVLNGDTEGAMQALRRALSQGIRPLHETLVALARLFGSKGHATKGMEILAAMEKLKYDVRMAWHVLVEELLKNNYLEGANVVFIKGAKAGIRARDELYDRMIEEDCKAGDHANALTIAYEMEATGKMATTWHFNLLLSVQATCETPEIAFATYENMEYAGEDYMRPDTETYNWVIQAYTRAPLYDRVPDIANILGMMLEDRKRVQPNPRTYALLVECFTKYSMINEALRHFRALRRIPGGTKVLFNEGNFGDPLSLYLRSLCLEGRIPELLDALEAMSNDEQQIAPRAMIVNRKYRTLVSSWIEPLQEEADLGYEIDYVARYVQEGGLTGERKRWVPRGGKEPLDPDDLGFEYSNPREVSFKDRRAEEARIYYRKVLRFLRHEGPSILGDDVADETVVRVVQWLRKIIKGPAKKVVRQPKAASKMVVAELREELEGQGLPTDGNRTVLYQRVQKARRINRSRGRPLWVPPVVEKEEEVDEELEELVSRVQLQDGNTEFWRKRFLGEISNNMYKRQMEVLTESSEKIIETEHYNEDEDEEAEEDEPKGISLDEDEDDDEEEEDDPLDQEDESEGRQLMGKIKDDNEDGPPQLISSQLFKDWQAPTKSKKIIYSFDDDEDWFPEDPVGAFKQLHERGYFKAEYMYTTADAWGWTWEVELKRKKPEKWSQDWEVELAIKIMQKVIELGGTPTIGDCAIILRAAIRSPLPSAFPIILQTTHSLGYVLGGPLYDEAITLCLELREFDAAIAIVADMETNGITVTDEILDRVLSSKKGGKSSSKE